MSEDSILFSFFLIFSGAALIATAALFARQALLVAYIALGVLLGPFGLELITDAALIADFAKVGIIFLLFLLGLNLEPRELIQLFREATLVTALSSGAFGAVGFAIGLAFGFNTVDSLLIGAAMMFSSTIIGLKLLPTSALHHQRMGEVIVSILLLQDIVAVLILLLLQGLGKSSAEPWRDIVFLLVALPFLIAFALGVSKYVLHRLFMSFDAIKEYIFLLTIGWCLGVAELAHLLGLSHEIGAFIAGVSLATNPICRYIAESLKPLRDFFLIMFFFALGAGFDLDALNAVFVPAVVLAAAALLGKPVVFRYVLKIGREKDKLAGEIGVRLGQISEFSLLIAVVATQASVLSSNASSTIQTAAILSFVVSSYWIVFKYPTPIAVDDKLRRD
ncbi:MAG: cation:proton antiporter [Pseudomonadota bacterium]